MDVFFNILIIFSIIGLILCLIGCVWIIVDTVSWSLNEEYAWEYGTVVIDRRFTRPDNYELLYRTTYENGLSVDRWIAVTREEYFDEWRKAQKERN